MKVEDIVKVLKNQLSKGNLVIHKTITPKEFKVFSDVDFKLYYVINKKKFLLIEHNQVFKILSDQKDRVLKDMTALFLDLIFTYVQGEEWLKVKDGRLDELVKI